MTLLQIRVNLCAQLLFFLLGDPYPILPVLVPCPGSLSRLCACILSSIFSSCSLPLSFLPCSLSLFCLLCPCPLSLYSVLSLLSLFLSLSFSSLALSFVLCPGPLGLYSVLYLLSLSCPLTLSSFLALPSALVPCVCPLGFYPDIKETHNLFAFMGSRLTPTPPFPIKCWQCTFPPSTTSL